MKPKEKAARPGAGDAAGNRNSERAELYRFSALNAIYAHVLEYAVRARLGDDWHGLVLVAALWRAEEWPGETSPIVRWGGMRDTMAFRYADELVNGYLLSETAALLILERWSQRCNPPLSRAGLRKILQFKVRPGWGHHKPLSAVLANPPPAPFTGMRRLARAYVLNNKRDVDTDPTDGLTPHLRAVVADLRAAAGEWFPQQARGANALERARRYVAAAGAMPEGERNNAAFWLSIKLLRGFALPPADAWPLIAEFGARCAPPMDAGELSATFASAEQFARTRATETPAGMLTATRWTRRRRGVKHAVNN